MSPCTNAGCACYEAQFDDRQAGLDLRRYTRAGPDRTTRLLLDALRAARVEAATLLDIGGGVGVIQHELLDAGARHVVHVDASPSYLAVAKSEAARRGHADRATFVHGDFVALAPTIDPADVVTLDRVICCYVDMPALVDASASHARRLYGIVVPRDAWWVRAGNRLGNGLRALRRRTFRTYVHPVADIDGVVARHGLRLRSTARTSIWQVSVYAR